MVAAVVDGRGRWWQVCPGSVGHGSRNETTQPFDRSAFSSAHVRFDLFPPSAYSSIAGLSV